MIQQIQTAISTNQKNKHKVILPPIKRPAIMGVLNVTPDSFSDGGLYYQPTKAITQARQMIDEGADIIDIGGESTRPGAIPVSTQEELDRVIPVIEALRSSCNVILSIDTSKPIVMREAIQAGATFINDVKALTTPGAIDIVAPYPVYICLMHMQGVPTSMQDNPTYTHITKDVSCFLKSRVKECLSYGIDTSRLIIDPGFGFGKTTTQNLQLLNELDQISKLNLPILVGWSRKSSIGKILNKSVGNRLYGSLATAVLALSRGASIIRTHDIMPTLDAVNMAHAVLTGCYNPA